MRLKSVWTLIVVAGLAAACGTTGVLRDRDLARLADPPPEIAADIAALLPGAIAFVEDSEREILRRGRPLTDDESRVARAVGVAQPDQVRILVHDDFLQPRDRDWLLLARRLGIDIDAEQSGRTAGYGIELQRRYARSRPLLAHELTHVAQYERRGVPALVGDYMTQLLLVGYERAPIEAEARANEHVR